MRVASFLVCLFSSLLRFAIWIEVFRLKLLLTTEGRLTSEGRRADSLWSLLSAVSSWAKLTCTPQSWESTYLRPETRTEMRLADRLENCELRCILEYLLEGISAWEEKGVLDLDSLRRLAAPVMDLRGSCLLRGGSSSWGTRGVMRRRLMRSCFSLRYFFSICLMRISFSRILSPIRSLVFLRMTMISLSCMFASVPASLNSRHSPVCAELSITENSRQYLYSQFFNRSIITFDSPIVFFSKLISSRFSSQILERMLQLVKYSMYLASHSFDRQSSRYFSAVRTSISLRAICSSVTSRSFTFRSFTSRFCSFSPFFGRLPALLFPLFSLFCTLASTSSVCVSASRCLLSCSSLRMRTSWWMEFFMPVSNLSLMEERRLLQKSLVKSSGFCNLERYCLNSRYLSWQVSSKIFSVFSRVSSARSLISSSSWTALEGWSLSMSPLDMRMLSCIRWSSSVILVSSFSQQLMAQSQCSISLACSLRVLTGGWKALVFTISFSISLLLALCSFSFSFWSIWMMRAWERKLQPLIMSICTLRKQSQRKFILRSSKQLSMSLKASSINWIMLRRQNMSSEWVSGRLMLHSNFLKSQISTVFMYSNFVKSSSWNEFTAISKST